MAKKFYAVRKGKKTGIFLTWDACKKQVDGFSGAEYKSFPSKEEAENYLGNGVSEKEKEEFVKTVRKGDGVIAYVDGSYDKCTNRFAYGLVIVTDEGELTFGEEVKDEELAQMHNVAGEIKGSEAAMRYALEKGAKKLVIYHDYEGIAKWCTGAWKANKPGTKAYKAFYDEISREIEIQFVKVKGHSNDKYNDMADMLAKRAIGL